MSSDAGKRSEPALTIRRFEAKDLESVRSLLIELAENLGEPYNVSPESNRRNADLILERRDDYSAFVACDPEVIGFVSMVFYVSLFHKTGTALINELVVSKRRRGQGIGAKLIDRAHKEARSKGMDELEVGVLKQNSGAIRFYRRNGFDEEYLLLGRELAARDPA